MAFFSLLGPEEYKIFFKNITALVIKKEIVTMFISI